MHFNSYISCTEVFFSGRIAIKHKHEIGQLLTVTYIKEGNCNAMLYCFLFNFPLPLNGFVLLNHIIKGFCLFTVLAIPKF